MNLSECFTYKGDTLYCESVDLSKLPDLAPASEHGVTTPLYVYSKQQILANIRGYKTSFAGRANVIGFSMKANPNADILRLMLTEGASIVAVSGFEIRLALDVGFPGSRIYFNGNGKQDWEMRLAIERGCVMNVDSVFNARQLVKIVGEIGRKIDVTLRLNVDIETQVHPYLKTGRLLFASI